MTRPLATLFTLAALVLLAGCAAAPTTIEPGPQTDASFTIDASSYAHAFSEVRDALRKHDFTLDRVDARAGVITTRPAPSAGFATPWIDHAKTTDEALTSFLNREQRIASVRFTPAQDETPTDMRRHEGEIAVRITVTVYRVIESARRHEASSILLSSRSTGRREGETITAQPGVFPVRDDDSLARAIRRSIDER